MWRPASRPTAVKARFFDLISRLKGLSQGAGVAVLLPGPSERWDRSEPKRCTQDRCEQGVVANNPTTCRRKSFVPSALSVIILGLVGCARHQAMTSLPGPPGPPRQDSFSDAIATIKHSIAPVVCVETHPTGDWDLRSIEGTALFVASDGSFVTPNHVLDVLTSQDGQTPCPTPAIYIPEGGVWRGDRARLRIHYALFRIQACRRAS